MPRSEPFSTIHAPLFDLKHTLDCGQVFHWTPVALSGEVEAVGYVGLIGNVPVRVEQHGGCIRVTPGTEELVRRYFSLDRPLEEIQATFPHDPAMRAALAYCRGLRLIRQPAWECLATFITSAMKRVAHIRQMSFALREAFGKPVQFGGETLYSYPDPQCLARASEVELRACGLGFRAKNLLATARAVADGHLDLEAIRNLSDEEALATLCRAPGVGPKIANCVLLFAYERDRSFPVDVWIERILRERYFPGKKATAGQLQEFASTYFGPFGGYAQQYLFHHARTG